MELSKEDIITNTNNILNTIALSIPTDKNPMLVNI